MLQGSGLSIAVPVIPADTTGTVQQIAGIVNNIEGTLGGVSWRESNTFRWDFPKIVDKGGESETNVWPTLRERSSRSA